ncbi:cold-shock protein [Streptomyces sp. NPDC059917]|uniref:cold-shock protein n=1 Tax=Streptomyces sp. NPDC059917 TaxID=3347002 RepID=UPI003664E486
MTDAVSEPLHEGHVQEWHTEEGWGVLVSPSLPAPVWAHFSSIAAEGYRELTVGQAVRFTAERAAQDRFAWRAVSVRVTGGPLAQGPAKDDGSGYSSGLDITFDR